MEKTKQKMNLPNKLTILRILLIPVIVIIPMFSSLSEKILFSGVSLSDLIVLIVFCIASFTDFLDGYIARKYKLVTDFGKFMDPLADKLLVFAAFIILIELNRIEGWIVMIIIAREFMVTGIRILAANNNCVIAASKLGKAKTISQMAAIIILLLNNYPFQLISIPMGLIVTYLAALLTIVSGVDYFIKNKSVIIKK
ncbi:MAG: CDP-diacylglycerol--glycerol-3-phosphate 3-phosphatidyltransferase [Bacilli bacterium]|nr:CDP-diacylglycerol--glycerol-3-phosphate 3-phosphatidyltransferase [Bacilli bacterium]